MRKHRLLNWISSGGFEKFYTPRVRLQAHITLWVVIFIIQYINIGVNYSESPGATATFALRNSWGLPCSFT
jgi:two-component system LytT family sensor kinase